MNVTVFGATGAIGSLTVAELLATGHTVTAHLRNIFKVPATWSFIGQATPAVLDPEEKETLTTRTIGFMPRTFMPRAYEEITGMSRIIMDSGRDLTIVRFIARKGTPKQARVRTGFFGTDKLGFAASRFAAL